MEDSFELGSRIYPTLRKHRIKRLAKSESEGGQSSPSDSILGGIAAIWIGDEIPLIPQLICRIHHVHVPDFFKLILSGPYSCRPAKSNSVLESAKDIPGKREF